MVKYKVLIFPFLIIFFLLFSFYPTIYEISQSNSLADPNREFLLEHNYYWPDFNLYLSKIRQGYQGRWTAVEKYTSELHRGSLLQIFYVLLGQAGKALSLHPNASYQLGRVILSPILLIIILTICSSYFQSFRGRLLSFLIVVVSGSFPKLVTDQAGQTHVIRYMEWWSNIDALQRITFIPHILFGQVASFYLLYQLTIKPFNHLTIKQFIFYILLGNAAGLVFPPSLITLNSVLLLLIVIRVKGKGERVKSETFVAEGLRANETKTKHTLLFFFLTLPSLLYIYIVTRQLPWSALVQFHRTHPMMIPFWEYVLGTGPVFFLGLAGSVLAVLKRVRKYYPLIFWVVVTFAFAVLFTFIKDQSPLRFTQTGLFIPLGILGSYFLYQLYHLRYLSKVGYLFKKTIFLFISFYLLVSFFMMTRSFTWQTTWISQRLGATIPAVPYPPQTTYPLREWMDGIRHLRDITNQNDVVLADITAGNYIPAYSGNYVYWGQSNTVDYERKQIEVERFFKGEMDQQEAQLFLKNNRIRYIFFSIQEREKFGGKNLESSFLFLKAVYSNPTVSIYTVRNE